MQLNTVRSQALLLGTGWTLACAAALAWFKSGALLPINLMSLAVVAMGWATLLVWAQAASQEAARESATAGARENRELIAGLARSVGQEMQRACGELVRTDELLEHAIVQLMGAFESVRDVDSAVTAMQFRDVVGQKLGHVRGELDALEQLMQRIHATRSVDFVLQVPGLLRELEQKRAANPVQQQLMHAGEVVLF